MDCSPPGSSVHGIFQVRILEWFAIPFFRRASWPRYRTQVSCIAGRFFTVWATRGVHIKKRWQEHTEELYKKDLHDPDNHEGVVTHLDPHMLECKAKWAWGCITINTASGGDGIPVELFQILKDDLNMPAKLENSAVATGLEKVSFHSNPKERQCQRMLKLPHNCTHLTG